jgi:hypothetical protein
VGSQAPCQPGARRKANARTIGAARRKTAEMPVAKLCASECQETFSHPASMLRQSRRKSPWRKSVNPIRARATAPRRPRRFGDRARHSPSATATTRIPVRFTPTWL